MMMSSRVQISCISVVTVMLMLLHVGCGTMKCGSTTALVMAVGFLKTIQTSNKSFILKYFRCRDGETRIGMESICITHSCIPPL